MGISIIVDTFRDCSLWNSTPCPFALTFIPAVILTSTHSRILILYFELQSNSTLCIFYHLNHSKFDCRGWPPPPLWGVCFGRSLGFVYRRCCGPVEVNQHPLLISVILTRFLSQQYNLSMLFLQLIIDYGFPQGRGSGCLFRFVTRNGNQKLCKNLIYL